MSNKNQKFNTTDLALATFLKLSGLEVASATPAKDNPHKIIFSFDDVETAVTLKNAYFNNNATVDPLKFINQYRNMKAMVSQS